MQPSGNLILPYPEGDEGYRKRFITTWNPLGRGKAISVGAEPAGRNLIETPKEALEAAPQPLAGGKNPFLRSNELRGRHYILVNEWGPYDFKTPILWPRRSADDTIRFEALGPRGRWTAKTIEGGTLSASAGVVPGYIEFKRTGKSGSRVRIELEYIGAKTVDYRGIESAAGTKVPFGYTDLSVPIAWNVQFYRWDKTTQDPRTHDAEFRSLIQGKPLAQMTASALDLVPGRIPRAVPNDYFATIAEGDFEIEPGDYILDTTLDDGGRVFLDGKPLVDEWHYQGPTLYTREVKLGGRHHLRVEHFQIDGYWTLKVGLRLLH
jgi:hypothetical protein